MTQRYEDFWEVGPSGCPIDYHSKNYVELYGVFALLALASGYAFKFEARRIQTIWRTPSGGGLPKLEEFYVGIRWTYHLETQPLDAPIPKSNEKE